MDDSKLWKILQEMEIPDHLICLLRNLYAGQEATVRMDMEKQTGSKMEKEYVKAVYCHPAYLAYMQAPHPSTLAWKIQWTEEPGGLHSMGSLRVGHD